MADIAKEFEDLFAMKTSELRDMWRRIYQSDPPARISRDLLIRAVAYRMQEEEHGGLSKAEKGRLHALAKKMNGEGIASFALSHALSQAPS